MKVLRTTPESREKALTHLLLTGETDPSFVSDLLSDITDIELELCRLSNQAFGLVAAIGKRKL